jgi:hypothetical protein
MSEYKKAILEIIDKWSKAFFAKQRSADIEKVASELFNKFRFQIENQTDAKTMFMLLKIMMSEGVMLDGARQLENPRTDA